MAIRKLARRLFKLVWFIVLFCIVSWIDVNYFSVHPMISNDTAIMIAHWLNSNPSPEDIYYSFDYVLIGFNLIFSFIIYIVTVKLIKKARSK